MQLGQERAAVDVGWQAPGAKVAQNRRKYPCKFSGRQGFFALLMGAIGTVSGQVAQRLSLFSGVAPRSAYKTLCVDRTGETFAIALQELAMQSRHDHCAHFINGDSDVTTGTAAAAQVFLGAVYGTTSGGCDCGQAITLRPVQELLD